MHPRTLSQPMQQLLSECYNNMNECKECLPAFDGETLVTGGVGVDLLLHLQRHSQKDSHKQEPDVWIGVDWLQNHYYFFTHIEIS